MSHERGVLGRIDDVMGRMIALDRQQRDGVRRFIAVLGCVPLLALCGPLLGGSIFMKNGYIIQGPIVERSEGSVVLGWNFGKVTIHKRFIDSVTFEQGEEKRLEEDEQVRAQVVSMDLQPRSLELTPEPEELPADVDQFIQKYVKSNTADLQGTRNGVGSASIETGLGGVEPPAVVTPGGVAVVVPRPEVLPSELVVDEELGFGLKPPKDWVVSRADGVFQVVGPGEEGGFRPSINVVAIGKGPLGAEEYVQLLKEENSRALEPYELISEGACTLGKEPAYEVLGRGAHEGRKAALRQVILVKGERLWLVSAFAAGEGGEPQAAAIADALGTFELTVQ